MIKTKFIIKTTVGDIPCDQDELIAVYRAIESGKPVFLRQGYFNPVYAGTIIEDKKTMEKFWEDNKYAIRDKEITKYPNHEDIFKTLREQVKELENKTGINRIELD